MTDLILRREIRAYTSEEFWELYLQASALEKRIRDLGLFSDSEGITEVQQMRRELEERQRNLTNLQKMACHFSLSISLWLQAIASAWKEENDLYATIRKNFTAAVEENPIAAYEIHLPRLVWVQVGEKLLNGFLDLIQAFILKGSDFQKSFLDAWEATEKEALNFCLDFARSELSSYDTRYQVMRHRAAAMADFPHDHSHPLVSEIILLSNLLKEGVSVRNDHRRKRETGGLIANFANI